MRAIIVDDEHWNNVFLNKILVEAGVEVSGCFTDPFEALSRVEKLQPDVIFIDIEMPGMSGLELAEKIYSGNNNAEIIFVTAYDHYAIDAFRVNAFDYLLKPLKIEQLKDTIKRVERRLQGTRENHDRVNNVDVRISLFGNLAVYVGNHQQPIHWITNKCAETFAYMLLQDKGKEVTKWKLIEALWHEKNAGKAEINLRSTISRLNKTLREYGVGIAMISTNYGYKLDLSGAEVTIDAVQIKQFALDSFEIDTNNVKRIEDALYDCDSIFLEQFSGIWCEPYRDQYRQYFVLLAKRLLTYYDSVSYDPLKSMRLVELLISLNPYEDSFQAKALRHIARFKGKKYLFEHYNNYVTTLKNEIGAEPSVTLKDLYHELIN
jgi:two-component system LytT family response regulator